MTLIDLKRHALLSDNSMKSKIAIGRKLESVIAIACFVIWRERCNRIFREENKIVAVLIEEVREKWSMFNKKGID
jgi:hypothetical protein